MNSDAVRPDKHLSHFLDKTRIALIAGLLISLVSISNAVAQETKFKSGHGVDRLCGKTRHQEPRPRPCQPTKKPAAGRRAQKAEGAQFFRLGAT
jgi:hypothetical protein